MEHILHIFGVGGGCGEHTLIPMALASISGISLAIRIYWHRLKAMLKD